MQLNTGATGQQVTAEDDGSLYSNIFGNGCYVLESGNQFKAEIQNNNRIKIYDGDALMQGRHVIIHANDSDVVIINNGTSKKNRKDLITIRYIKGNDGVEDAYLNVIQGTEVDGVPAAPEHVDGNILTGATTKDFPIYEVELQGINIIEVTPLFEVLGSIATTNSHLADSVAELNRKLPVFKRRNSSEAGICTPHYIMIMGTLVLQGANADYRQLFSASDLLSKILKFYDPSISNFDEGKCVITTNNGDGNAAAIHFYAPEWWGSNNAYYQYFYPGTSSTIRVNYCIHYLKL